MRRLLMSVFLGLLFGACGIIGPDEYRRVIGDIGVPPHDDVFAVPDSVWVGEAFTFRFRTYGWLGDRSGDTHVEIQGNVATITPYDYYRIDRIRRGPFPHFLHEATVQFVEVGEAQVILRGRASSDEMRSVITDDGMRIVITDTIEVSQTTHVYSR